MVVGRSNVGERRSFIRTILMSIGKIKRNNNKVNGFSLFISFISMLHWSSTVVPLNSFEIYRKDKKICIKPFQSVVMFFFIHLFFLSLCWCGSRVSYPAITSRHFFSSLLVPLKWRKKVNPQPKRMQHTHTQNPLTNSTVFSFIRSLFYSSELTIF